MQCANCNETLREQDRFCPLCGTPAARSDELPQSPELSQEETLPPQEEADLIEKTDDPAQDADTPKEKKLSSTRKPIWALLALLLIAFSTLVILILANVNLKSDKHTRLLSKELFPVRITAEESTAWGYMDENGALVIPAVYDEALPFAENGLAAVRQGEKWGYVNTKGESVIPCTFDDAGDFTDDNLAPVKSGELWGYIDHKGNMVINLQFDDALGFSENGLALVSIGELCGYINRRGVYTIPPQFSSAASFDEDGYAVVCAYGKWGMIDHKGDYVINPQFDDSFVFGDSGFAAVKQGELYGYIDRSGTFLAAPQFITAENFSRNGLALVQSTEGKYGYINQKGEWAISAKFDDALSFADNGLAAVCLSADVGLWGYIDKTGTFKISPIYADASSFSEGLAPVCDDNGYFFIDEEGTEVIRLTGLRLPSRFTADGFAVVRCYALYEDESGLMLPIATHYEIINTAGTVIHTDKVTGFAPSHLRYIFGR